jgi:hypothetical protein
MRGWYGPRPSWRSAAVLAALLLAPPLALPAAAQGRECSVRGARGATTPEGTTVAMRVVNNGKPCAMRIRLDPDAGIDFTAVSVARDPANGTVSTSPTGFAYTPRPGFTGADSFDIAAWGMLRGSRRDGRIAVTVEVVRP